MTRTFTRDPVWTWYCDRCDRSSGDLSWLGNGLPTADEMRSRGWFIAEKWGDRCAQCVAKERDDG
jgi:hypothetical protein